MWNSSKTTVALFLLCGASGLMACDRDAIEDDVSPFDLVDPERTPDQGMNQPDEAPDTQPDMAQGSADMSAPDMAPDMSPGGSPDMGPDMAVEVLREVVRYDLFGKMRVANQFKDPRFDNLNVAYDWFATSGDQLQLLPSYRKVYAKTPMGTPVMEVAKSRTGRVNGSLMLTRRPSEYSVWIGRDGVSLQGEGPAPEVNIYGTNTRNPRDFSGIQLQAEESSKVQIGSMRWTRFVGLSSGFAGYGFLVIDDPSTRSLFVHAPQAIFVPVGANALLPALISPRAVNPRERKMLQESFEFVRSQRPSTQERPVPYPF